MKPTRNLIMQEFLLMLILMLMLVYIITWLELKNFYHLVVP